MNNNTSDCNISIYYIKYKMYLLLSVIIVDWIYTETVYLIFDGLLKMFMVFSIIQLLPLLLY